jgi:hypothetical protein
MPVPALRLLACWVAASIAGVLTGGCSHTVEGLATRPPAAPGEGSHAPIAVGTVMLDKAQMRAITGAGDALNVIPSMDVSAPVDIDMLAKDAPTQCQWFFDETQTFGADLDEFHKTTFQNPPKGALISEAAATYSDGATAGRTFDGLVKLVKDCESTDFGPTVVGNWTAGSDALRTRTSAGCGRDYRVKSVVLVEVTFCAFADSVPDIVIANMLAKVPG